MEQAQTELSALGAQAAAAFPLTHARLQPRVMPYAHAILDIQGITTWEVARVQSIMSLLVVIVAVNVGVLVYARTATRQREIAVRTALGASRRRVVGQLFIEALVLSAMASIAGIGLARFGMAQGYAIFAAEGNGPLPYFIDRGMPFAVYVYIAALTLFAAAVSGVLPALHATGRRVQDTFEAINLPRSGLSNHVLIAGWGRVGRSVGDALSHLNLPYVLVEFDDRRVRQARAAGVPVIYGDASQTVGTRRRARSDRTVRKSVAITRTGRAWCLRASLGRVKS